MVDDLTEIKIFAPHHAKQMHCNKAIICYRYVTFGSYITAT